MNKDPYESLTRKDLEDLYDSDKPEASHISGLIEMYDDITVGEVIYLKNLRAKKASQHNLLQYFRFLSQVGEHHD